MDMEDKDLIADTIYSKATYWGFNLTIDVSLAIATLVISIIMGALWFPLGILSFVGGIVGIIKIRNLRNKNPRGYFRHLFYHYGLIPFKNLPNGLFMNDQYHE